MTIHASKGLEFPLVALFDTSWDGGPHETTVMVDPLMDWALGERVGGERPPDLVDAMRARLAEAPVAAPRARFAPSQLVAAALLLLGIAVVCGVALWPKAPPQKPDDAPVAGPQEPKPIDVHNSRDIAALSGDTRAVEAIAIDDAKLAELARLRELEVLVLRDPSNEAFGLSPKMGTVDPARPHRYVTAAAWEHIARFTKLRRLELSGIVCSSRFSRGVDGEARVVEAFAQLERLPLLESLSLRFLDTPDEMLAVLPRLSTLRQLDLSFNHGFGIESVRAIARCRGLRKLSLRGCQQLHGDDLALLSELPELEEVDLSAIDGVNWRLLYGVASEAVSRTEVEGALIEQRRRWEAHRAGRVGGMGPNDATLEALAALPNLRSLNISGGEVFTGAGLAALGRCTTLRVLNASGLRQQSP